jgi:hypothetical protein
MDHLDMLILAELQTVQFNEVTWKERVRKWANRMRMLIGRKCVK